MKNVIKNITLIILAIACVAFYMACRDTSAALQESNDYIAQQQSQISLLNEENAILVEDMTRIEDQLAAKHDEVIALSSQVNYLLSVKGVRNSLADITDEERDMLKRLAMAEAGNQGVIGKAMVMLTVVNRMEHPTKYSNTIEGVVLSGAYTVTVPGGSYWTCVPDEECDAALYLVEHGYTEEMLLDYMDLDTNLKAYYFTNQGFSYGEKLFQYKNHYFSGYTLE